MQNNANSISGQSHGAKTKSLEVLVQVVLNSLPSASSKRVYRMAIRDFLGYWQSEGEPKLDKLFLQTYIAHMQNKGVGEASINLRLAAIRKLSREAVELQIWSEEVTAAFASIKNIPQRGKRTGNWLSLEQSQQLINAPDTSTNIGLRDRALLAVLIGCGIRRQELTKLTPSQLQLRDGRWVITDLVGKRNKARTVTVPTWVKEAIDAYVRACDIQSGQLFQAMSKSGSIQHEHICGETVRDIVYKYAYQCRFNISPHDLRRTYAKLAHKNGAKIDQIQLNLGHHSLATTQVYLGNELDLNNGPGDFLDINIE